MATLTDVLVALGCDCGRHSLTLAESDQWSARIGIRAGLTWANLAGVEVRAIVHVDRASTTASEALFVEENCIGTHPHAFFLVVLEVAHKPLCGNRRSRLR